MIREKIFPCYHNRGVTLHRVKRKKYETSNDIQGARNLPHHGN